MIAIGCDHGGFELKQEIIRYLEEKNIEYHDFAQQRAIAHIDFVRFFGHLCPLRFYLFVK